MLRGTTYICTLTLNAIDTVLQPSLRNKKTVLRPDEKDFKETNVSLLYFNFSIYQDKGNFLFLCCWWCCSSSLWRPGYPIFWVRENERRNRGRLPLVRTGRPDQSICKEDSTIKKNCLKRSVYFDVVCIAGMLFKQHFPEKEAYFIFKMAGLAGQFCHMESQPRSQGPLSTSRKYHGYGWSRVYTCQLQTHRGWVLNKLQLQLSSPSLRSYLWNLLKSSRHVTSRNQGTFSR